MESSMKKIIIALVVICLVLLFGILYIMQARKISYPKDLKEFEVLIKKLVKQGRIEKIKDIAVGDQLGILEEELDWLKKLFKKDQPVEVFFEKYYPGSLTILAEQGEYTEPSIPPTHYCLVEQRIEKTKRAIAFTLQIQPKRVIICGRRIVKGEPQVLPKVYLKPRKGENFEKHFKKTEGNEAVWTSIYGYHFENYTLEMLWSDLEENINVVIVGWIDDWNKYTFDAPTDFESISSTILGLRRIGLMLEETENKEVRPCSHPQKTQIRKSLVEMLTQSEDPFLIVEDPKTESFIQFRNEDRKILIDFPQCGLKTAEIKAAKGYFFTCGIRLKETESLNPETGEAFKSKSWNRSYSRGEIDKVVNISLGALFEINGISESTPLVLKTGWEKKEDISVK